MSTISSNYLPTYLTSYLGGAANTGTGSATAGGTGTSSQSASGGSASNGDAAATISLSEEAKAYLAAAGTTSETNVPPAQSARAWLDEQYKKLGITSPTPDGKPALDLTGLSRENLAAITQNNDKKFSDAETKAAAGEVQKRFDDAVTPHMAIARKTGNYTALYQAAADYLDQAGAGERATKTWTDDKKAIADGLAAAKARPGQAPDTDAAKDPIRALLDKRTAAAAGASADAEAVAKSARALLDDQANQARDDGGELVFSAREKGQLVDFSKFNNRTLAAVALNKDDAFSGEEARAAKNELNQRTRNTMLGVLNPTSGSASGGAMNLGMIRTYENMSDEEKSVLGVTDAVTDRLIQNFQTLQSMQNAFAGGGSGGMFGLSAALLANQQNNSDDTSIYSLAGLL